MARKAQKGSTICSLDKEKTLTELNHADFKKDMWE
jgi:hypothetical protein